MKAPVVLSALGPTPMKRKVVRSIEDANRYAEHHLATFLEFQAAKQPDSALTADDMSTSTASLTSSTSFSGTGGGELGVDSQYLCCNAFLAN